VKSSAINNSPQSGEQQPVAACTSGRLLSRVGRISPGYQRVLLVAVCAVLFCLWLLKMPLTEIDEVRFSEATREMVSSGNYIIPTFNGELRFQKPILYYWIQSASIRLFGQYEAAARFPSALAAILLVLLIHGFLLRWLPSRLPEEDDEGRASARGAALLGGLVSATVLLTILWARAATTDMSLTLFISATLLALLQADLTRAIAQEPPRQVRRWYLVAAATAALAFLTKGPIGAVIPFLTWLCYHLYQRNLRAEIRRVPWLLMAGLFLLIAAPWYIATLHYVGTDFLKHFFMNENVQRFTKTQEGHGASNHLQGLFTYPLMTLVFLFPYSPFLLREMFKPFAENPRLRADDMMVRIRRFSWCWLGGTIVLFSLSSTQLPSYIQSIIGAAAILFALHALGRLTNESESSAGKKGFALETAFIVIIGAAIVGYLSYGMFHSDIFKLVRWVPPASIPYHTALLAAICLGITGGLFVLGVLLWGLLRRADAFIGWTMATWTLVLTVLVLLIGPLTVQSNYSQMVETGKYLQFFPRETPVFAYFGSAPETLVYYAQRPILLCSMDEKEVYFHQLLAEKMVATHQGIVVTDKAHLRSLKKKCAVTLLKEIGPIQVYQVNLLPPNTPLPANHLGH